MTLLRLATTALAVGSPILVVLGLRLWSARTVALLVLVLVVASLALRFGRGRRERAPSLATPIVLLGITAVAAWTDESTWLLLMPAAINAALLVAFGSSLRATPMIEQFARVTEPDLPPEAIRWCRNVTVVWCAFFLLNGSIALGLALWGPLRWWTIYNAGIAYLLIGALLLGEVVLRKRHLARSGPPTSGDATQFAGAPRS